jgi:cytoskeletal protein CcmA (bactofilin family)
MKCALKFSLPDSLCCQELAIIVAANGTTQAFVVRDSLVGGKMSTEQRSRTSETSPRGSSTIGEDLVITGNVTSNSELQIDGHVHGDVHCTTLVLGETSEIKGNVVAEDVVIRGRVIGSVRGTRVILQSTCHVEGDLLHTSLAMEQGAYFEGKSRRSENPLAVEPSATGPQPAESADSSSETSSKRFIRSLEGSNSADHRIN